MWRKTILGAAAVLVATALPACSADDGRSINIAVADKANQNNLPVVLADRLGFFRQQGLDVTVDDVRQRSQVTTAVLSGDAQAMTGFYDHACDLRAKGKEIESVATLNRSPGMAVLARPGSGVDGPADMRNRTFGVASLGGATKYLSDYLAVRNGVPVEQVHYNPAPDGPTFLAAFQHGRVDAGITTEPTISALLHKGLGKVVVDLRTAEGTDAALGGPYPGTSLMLRTSWANAHPEVTQKVVNGVRRALRWMDGHSPEQIADAVPRDFYRGTGKADYARALAELKGYLNPSARMPPGAPATVSRVLSTVDPAVRGHELDLEQTYTDRYAREAARIHGN